MTLDINTAEREFDQQIDGHAQQEARRQIAALRLIAAHALTVAPEATHMLMEASDQGDYLCPPTVLTIGEEHVAEQEWDAHLEEYEDSDLSSAPSWLPWGSDRPDSDGWGQFVDNDHPFTNRHGGYYAIDLRRVVAETSTAEPSGGDEPLEVAAASTSEDPADVTAAVRGAVRARGWLDMYRAADDRGTSDDEALCDLLTDLRHLADQMEPDAFYTAMDSSYRHYLAEVHESRSGAVS